MNQPKSRNTSQLLLTAPFAGLSAAIVLLSGIPAMAAPPTTVYAGGTGGVFRSTDGGVTWSPSLLPNVTVQSLAMDPTNGNVIYAASGAAVYKTTNGGANWTKETNGLTGVDDGVATTLQIDPANPNIIYLGSGGAAFGSGVFKSTDGGVNWTQMNNGLVVTGNGIPSVEALALDPLSTNTVYEGGVTGLQAGKTTNGAVSWTPLSPPNGFVFSIAIHPVNDSIVFMAGPFGLVKSTDGGTTWTSPLFGFIQSIAIDPNTPTTMYADATVGTNCPPPPPPPATQQPCATETNTVYKSLDTGNTWNVVGALPSVNEEFAQTGPLVIDPGDTSTLYLGGDTGVSKSTDGGTTWTLVMPSTGINALATAPNAVQQGFFNVFEDVAQGAIALAEDFKGNPALACGILNGSLTPIPGLVQAGLLSSGQGQALTLQIQNAEASIPCPSK
jgi:photosystem II stability/assembly factor-like uncharacterized protein